MRRFRINRSDIGNAELQPTDSNKSRRGQGRRAFTLLEVLLALALSFLVLYAISMAINLHLRMLDTRQKEIEQAQLSRSVLRLIRDDIRGAVQYTPFDTSALEELIAGIDPLTADLLAAEVTGDAPDPDAIAAAAATATSGDTATQEEPEASTVSQEVATTAYPPTRPGVYGNETSLSIDVSRLPRRDQLLYPINSGLTDALPSDVKTISYYIGEQSQQSSGNSVGSQASPQTGLVRREVDRAVSRYATDSGGTIDLTSAAKVIAPEVTQIFFSYYDGEEWQSSWDSGELKKLPVAIQVTVKIGGENLLSTNNSRPASQLQRVQEEVHQMTVYLNISEAVSEETEE